MNRQTKALKLSNAQREQIISQFQTLTTTSQQDAAKILKKYNYNLNNAIDAYFSNSAQLAERHRESSSVKLGQLFDKYKAPEGDMIGINGTIQLCQDLGVAPEDVVLVAIAHELKCPGVGEFKREGWIQGLQGLNCDSLDGLKRLLPSLRQKLLTDPDYFRTVYMSTFNFAKPADARVMPLETALDFQTLLIPPALGPRGALSSASPPGFTSEHFQWWTEFLTQSNIKAVTKDVWNNFIDFVRQIDARFETHDIDAAWPSVIDDFVTFAKKKVATQMDEDEEL